MKSINDTNEIDVGEYVDAKTLQEMTLSPEDLFQIQKDNICKTIMDSMVGQATKNGNMFYSTNLLETMDSRLREEIVEKFESLGYIVKVSEVLETQQQTDKGVQKFVYRMITLSWAKQEESTES